MSLDNIDKRINRVLRAIEQRQRQDQGEPLPLYLLASSEQEQFTAFLEQLQNKYACECISKSVLRLVTDEELDQLGNWIRLLDALEQEDLDTASRYRQCLNTSSEQNEQLVAAFLAIEETDIPDWRSIERAPVVTRDGVTRTLYRTHFRHYRQEVERALEQGRLTGSLIDEMRLWVETFLPAQAA
jgi:hypothetical protein